MLTDNHGRKISYLRLAVTDRCNLRCFYCMPEHGLNWIPPAEVLSFDEIMRVCTLLAGMGIDKIRITGGEPFLRKDIIELLTAIAGIQGVNQLSITTNGVLTASYVAQLKAIGIHSVNLSLDTLDAGRFFSITRRNAFDKVMHTMSELLKYKIPVKINAVVMAGRNTQDIIPLAMLTKNLPVDVRFIEEMPFNGDGHAHSGQVWNYQRIMDELQQEFPTISKAADEPYATATNYNIEGHQGRIGIIAAYSRTFCGTCNRIRITPQGTLKTCLYDDGVLNIKQLMRDGVSDAGLAEILLSAFNNREKDGFAAEQKRAQQAGSLESMATIGG